MHKFSADSLTRILFHFNIFLITGLLFFPCTAYPQTALRSTEVQTTTDRSEGRKWTGHFSYIIGYKKMADEWAPAENQFEFGLVDFDFRRTSWPISIAGQVLLTYSDNEPDIAGVSGDYSGTYEFNLGIRKIWRPQKKIQPFLGGGLSIIGASTTKQIDDYEYEQPDNDWGWGYWAGAGAYWIISKNFHTGINIQYTYGEISLFGKDLNAGGLHLNALIGFHW